MYMHIYICLIGRVHVSYVGHIDKSRLYETLFHCNILNKHHHHMNSPSRLTHVSFFKGKPDGPLNNDPNPPASELLLCSVGLNKLAE
jgi:hypothetical protein